MSVERLVNPDANQLTVADAPRALPLQVVPMCGFVRAVMRDHPEYASLGS